MALTGVDLFCGAGGSSVGARMAGVTMVGAVDMWPVATATYGDNFPSARPNLHTARLTRSRADEILNGLGCVDILIASPECTHHSLARGNRPKCPESQGSAWYVTRFIEELAPEAIVLENVSMMRHWHGYQALLSDLEDRYGYQIREQVLDAADFGVPQNRKRLFVFGSRKRRPPMVSPTVRRHHPARSVLDKSGKWPASPLDNGRRAARTLERVRNAIELVGRGRDFLTVYYGSDKAGGYQTLDRPLRTLTTLDRFGLVQWREGEPTLRMLQVPELRRAMGLPQGFRMEQGTRRDKIKLLGNGVCPPVMKAVVEAALFGECGRQSELDLEHMAIAAE